MYPNVFACSTRIAYRRLPLWDEHSPIRARRTAASQDHRAVAAPAALLVLIHCAAGNDRTGIVAALWLAAVGVPNETIAEDYALSIALSRA
jgi:protein-tyrosine phosphatase